LNSKRLIFHLFWITRIVNSVEFDCRLQTWFATQWTRFSPWSELSFRNLRPSAFANSSWFLCNPESQSRADPGFFSEGVFRNQMPKYIHQIFRQFFILLRCILYGNNLGLNLAGVKLSSYNRGPRVAARVWSWNLYNSTLFWWWFWISRSFLKCGHISRKI